MLVYRGKEADNSENDLLGVLGGLWWFLVVVMVFAMVCGCLWL